MPIRKTNRSEKRRRVRCCTRVSTMKSRKRKRDVGSPSPKPVKAEAPATPVVVLASHCAVKDASQLKASLCAVAAEALPVALDVGSVQRMDTATVQLLCVFAVERRAKALKIEWRGSSAVFDEAVKLLGVRELLGMPAEGAAV